MLYQIGMKFCDNSNSIFRKLNLPWFSKLINIAGIGNTMWVTWFSLSCNLIGNCQFLLVLIRSYLPGILVPSKYWHASIPQPIVFNFHLLLGCTLFFMFLSLKSKLWIMRLLFHFLLNWLLRLLHRLYQKQFLAGEFLLVMVNLFHNVWLSGTILLLMMLLGCLRQI